MSKTIILLSICLVALISLSLGIIFLYPTIQKDNSFVSQIPFTATPTTPTSVTLQLTPTNQQLVKGQINKVNILLDAKSINENDTPQIIQMEIAYDPLAFSDVSITPGDFFTDPTVLLSTINIRTGRISYALAASQANAPSKTTGVVATISFVPNPTFAGAETTLSFLGKTMIRGKNDINLLTDMYGTRLYLASSSGAQN